MPNSFKNLEELQKYAKGKNLPTGSYVDPKSKRGLVGNLVGSIVDPATRILQASAGKTFMGDDDRKDYENPWNIAKDVASVGSLLIPAGAAGQTLKGAVKTGIATGGASGFGSSYGKDLEGTIGDTVMGGVTGGGLSFVGGLVSKGVGKLAKKEAGKGGKLAKNLREKGTELQGSALEVSTGKDVRNPKQAKLDATEQLVSRGKKVSSEGAIELQDEVMDYQAGLIDDYMKKRPLSSHFEITEDDILNEDTLRAIQNAAVGTLDDKQTSRVLMSVFGKEGVGKSTAGGRLYSVGDLNGIYKDINAQLRNTSNKATAKVLNAAKKRIGEVLEQKVPGFKEQNVIYSQMENVRRPTAIKEMKGTPSASQNILRDVLPVDPGVVKDKIKAGTGKVLTKVADVLDGNGGVVKDVAQKIQGFEDYLTNKGVSPSKVATLVASRAFLDFEDDNNNGVPDQEEGFDSIQEPTPEVDDAERFNAIMEEYIKIGKDPITARKQAIALVGYDPADQGNNLTAAQKTTSANIDDSLSGLAEVKDSFNKMGSSVPLVGNILNANPFDADRQGFELQIAAINQRVSKALEGGKMTDADRAFYNKYLLKAGDTKATALKKIQILEKGLLSQKENLTSVGG